MEIDLNLKADVTYEYVSPSRGGTHPDGTEEILAGYVEILSVVVDGIDIRKVLTQERLQKMAEDILEARNA